MSRKITQEETKELFQFCQEMKVEHYDLQVELVDHMASYIEEKWENNIGVPFHDLLYECFGKFGVYGFSKMKKQKQKELSRKYNRVHSNFIKEFYTWPKFIMTLTFTLALFTLFKLTNSVTAIYIIYFIVAILTIAFFYFYYSPKKLKIQIINNQNFLLLEYLKNLKNSILLTAFLPLNIVNVFFLSFKNSDVSLSQIACFNQIGSNSVIFVYSFLMVAFGISLYSKSFYISKKIKDHFVQQFPEFTQ